MTWSTIMLLMIIASGLKVLLARKLALKTDKLFFTVALISLATVALFGFIYATLYFGYIPAIPSGHVWWFLLAEGLMIPMYWLAEYKLIQRLGASNAITINSTSIFMAALTGIIFLNESISWRFALATLFFVLSIVTIRNIAPDTKTVKVKFGVGTISLVIFMGLMFAGGIFFEKLAINTIGVWNYAAYGWTMQFLGASMLMLMFGRHEVGHASPVLIRKVVLLGFVTSIAGGLFIYGLSIGTLSHTVTATIGKIAFTILLAAIFLGERNAMKLRITSFILAAIGVYLLVS